jgi:hypothetical protein
VGLKRHEGHERAFKNLYEVERDDFSRKRLFWLFQPALRSFSPSWGSAVTVGVLRHGRDPRVGALPIYTIEDAGLRMQDSWGKPTLRSQQ